jgi:formate dehydrogenase major subunit
VANVTINLDGINVEAMEGQSILEVAQAHGVNIPTLCHDPRLKPTAACRLCLVEIEKMRNPMPACNTLVSAGMVVKSSSQSIIESRRIALELLLSDHYGDCVSPCQLACPAEIDIQGQIAFIASGQHSEALKLIKESNPLPLVCGRVCPRFCEKKCRRSLIDEPVAINLLKRFVADYELKSGEIYNPRVQPHSGQRVAIVGGGPAGLTAAYYLALKGHSISLFESSPQLGGMLRYGIPEYRLPKAVLDKEIAAITQLCAEVKCNFKLGRDFTLENLKSEGFKAIFLAVGAQNDQKMRIPGEELAGVYSGIGFLRDVIENRQSDLGHRVVVVGGGNTAIDAARTALRCGASEVSLVYRRSRAEMPASAEEVEGAEQEGVKIQFLTNPLQIKAGSGRVAGVECTRMVLGAPDSSGRRKPESLPGSEFVIECETVIMALGQSVDTLKLEKSNGLKINPKGVIEVNPETMQTNLAGVFSGGDCTTGPATAVEAIGAGRRASTYIHQYLSADKIIPVVKSYNCSKGELENIDRSEFIEFEKIKRAAIPALEAESRRHNFQEIDSTISEEAALIEAGRCLSCGCQDVFECRLRVLATEYKANDRVFAGQKRHLPILKNDHPYIVRDRNKCILCGRCVRICSEVESANALGFTQRGFSTTVEPALGMALSETTCTSCGLCISTCPTGAITARTVLPKPGPFKLFSVSSTCSKCGIGCNIDIKLAGNIVSEVTSPLNNPVNQGNLCQAGSFEISHPPVKSRLIHPQINENGQMRQTAWPEAINLAARSLEQIKKKFGPESITVLCSPYLINEDLYLTQKMARAALSTNNIGSIANFSANNSLNLSLGKNASSATFQDIRDSDYIIAFECDPVNEFPVVALQIREAVSRGSRLTILNSTPTALDTLSSTTLKVNRRTGAGLLKAALQYMVTYNLLDEQYIAEQTSGFETFLKQIKKMDDDAITQIPWVSPSRLIDIIHGYVRAKRPIIIVNGDTIGASELLLIADLALAAGNIGRPGSGLIKLHSAPNVQGLLDMGCNSQYLPGQQKMTSSIVKRFSRQWGIPLSETAGRAPQDLFSGLERGEIKGLVVVGKEALGNISRDVFAYPLFSLLIDTEAGLYTPAPQIILPAAEWLESSGSRTNCERRVLAVNPVAEPAGGLSNWQILAHLSTALGYPMNYPSALDIQKEIQELIPEYKTAAVESGVWPFASEGKSGTVERAIFKMPKSDVEGNSPPASTFSGVE